MKRTQYETPELTVTLFATDDFLRTSDETSKVNDETVREWTPWIPTK